MDSFKPSKSNLISLMVLLIALLNCFSVSNAQAQTVRGVTASRAPFIDRASKDTPYQGYFVDLLDQLASIGSFNYTLYELSVTPNVESQRTWLLNEIQNGNADFAIADFLDNNKYQSNNAMRYSIDFTEPYQDSGLSALIRKDQKSKSKINKFEDLIKKTTGKDGKDIEFGTMRPLYSVYSMYLPNDELYQRMRMTHNLIVDNREAGIERTIKDPYTFIQEAFNNELAADEHCELTHLPLQEGKQGGIHFEYGIAVKRGSPFLEIFNNALRELKASGKLQEIKRKHWNRKCNSAFSLQQFRYYLTGFSTLFSLALSLFLLS